MHPVFVVVVLALIAQASASGWEQPKRSSRSMIFPELAPTPVTFLCAFGIPVENLSLETVIVGYALRMQYFLPNNATEINRIYLKPQPITDRKYNDKFKDDFSLGSMYRWVIYGAIEMALQNMGLPGRSCLLRAICEHAAILLSHESGLLGELLYIILTPSTSKDQFGKLKERVYQSAERFGRRGGNCEAAFARKCKNSPIDLITILLKVNKND